MSDTSVVVILPHKSAVKLSSTGKYGVTNTEKNATPSSSC